MLHKFILPVLCAIFVAFVPILADDGTAPVFAPGFFIGASGSYTVTSNLVGGPAGCPGPVVVIGAPDVELDLNGFVLDNTGCPAAVILIVGPADHVKIKNGTLVGGGGPGIDAPLGPLHRKVDLEDLKIHDSGASGVHLGDVETVAVRRVQIVSPALEGILWDGGVIKSGTIENNIIRGASNGIIVTGGSSSLAIQNNRLEDLMPPGFGIVLELASANLIAENTIESVAGEGIFLFVPPPFAPPGAPCLSQGNKLFDNVINQTGSHGIHIDLNSCDNLLLNNVVTYSGAGVPGAFASGLLIEGSRNFLHGNLSNFNNTFGLHFWDSAGPGQACGNGFGRNVARGNFGIAAPAPCGPGPALFPPNSCNTAVACPPGPLGLNTSALNNLIPGLF